MRRETGHIGRLNAHHALAALGARQHTLFSIDDVKGLGIAPGLIHKRAARGALHRVHHGVYSLVPPELLTREGRYMAAVLACGPGAVLSHRAAAHLHALRRTERFAIDVTVPGRTSRTHSGIEVHRSATLDSRDITLVDGIPCTTIARTLLDLAGVLTRRQLERTLDQAETTGRLDLHALQGQIDRNRKSHAAARLKAVLGSHTSGSTVTWSELEERFLSLCAAADLPPPEVNQWIAPDDGEPAMRVDFAWRRQRLIVETDGHQSHRTRAAFERDRARDQRLTLAGWRVIRITWRQLHEAPERIAGLIAGLLASGAR